MISLTERTILDKRILGCICDHGTTECKDIVSLCDAHRGYCGVYVCNKGLQEILRLTALNDAMGCIDAFYHPEFISGSIQCGSLQFNAYKMLLEFLPRSQSFGKGTLFQEPQSVRYPALMPCRNSLKQVQHDDGVCKTGLPRHCVARNDGDVTTRFFGLRPLNDGVGLQEILRLTALNDGMDCHATAWLAMTDKTKPETNRNLFGITHNDQNGLVLMFGSSKQHMAQETKPDFDRNMIEREVA